MAVKIDSRNGRLAYRLCLDGEQWRGYSSHCISCTRVSYLLNSSKHTGPISCLGAALGGRSGTG